MRINIYAEELTSEVTLITKEVEDEEFGKRTFYGLRIWLVSPKVLHHSEHDDDRSAITFWIPWTRYGGHNPVLMLDVIRNLSGKLYQAIAEMQSNGEKYAWVVGVPHDGYPHPTRGIDGDDPVDPNAHIGSWTLP